MKRLILEHTSVMIALPSSPENAGVFTVVRPFSRAEAVSHDAIKGINGRQRSVG